MKQIIRAALYLVLGMLARAGDFVDINTSTAEELQTVPGIGPALSQRIIDARPYGEVKDLLKVKGIGEATLKKLENLVSVGGAAPAEAAPGENPAAEPEAGTPAEPGDGMRTWTSLGGSEVTARLVGLKDGMVILQRETGGRIGIALARLSLPDQKLAQAAGGSTAPEAEPAPAPGPDREATGDDVAKAVEAFIKRQTANGHYLFFDRKSNAALKLQPGPVSGGELRDVAPGQHVVSASFSTDDGKAYVLDFFVLGSRSNQLIVLAQKTQVQVAAGEARYTWEINERTKRWEEKPIKKDTIEVRPGKKHGRRR